MSTHAVTERNGMVKKQRMAKPQIPPSRGNLHKPDVARQRGTWRLVHDQHGDAVPYLGRQQIRIAVASAVDPAYLPMDPQRGEAAGYVIGPSWRRGER